MDFIKELKTKYNIDLNAQQKEAVQHKDGPCLLLSVPGGGKTTVIVSRCANLILNHKVNPEKILTLTFSRMSAKDMELRFKTLFGYEIGHNISFSTIHSFCYSTLKMFYNLTGRYFPQIIERSKSKFNKHKMIREIYFKTNREYLGDDRLEDLITSISYVKNMMYKEEDIECLNSKIDNFYIIFRKYEYSKMKNNLIDFDDLLTMTYKLLKKDRKFLNHIKKYHKYINVDESQDNSLIQHKIIETLVYPENNLFMVGDEDQCIYSFRAAYSKALLSFNKIYPEAKILLMETNYRSTEKIIAPANLFIKQNKNRFVKHMISNREKGIEIKFTILEEKNKQYEYLLSILKNETDYKNTAVLFRNNVSSIPLIDKLVSEKIPFRTREHNLNFFTHWITLDIVYFIKLSMDPYDIKSFSKIYYKLNCFLSKEHLEFLESNKHLNKNVFDTLLKHPDLTKRMQNKIKNLSGKFEELSIQKPSKAITFINLKIGYGKYLKKYQLDNSSASESIVNIIDNLRTLAENTNKFEEFFYKIRYLKDYLEKSKNNNYNNEDKITLSTIHSCKGLEFEKVFIIDLIEGQFPSTRSIEKHYEDKSLMEEEIRLFYVAITRAKTHLELISCKNSNNSKLPVSRFFKKLQKLQKDIFIKDITEEIDLNQKLIHNKFGEGIIKSLDKKSGVSEIEFNKIGLKKVSIFSCLEDGIIEIEKKSI